MPDELLPSEVRERVLADHHRLRERIAKLRALIEGRDSDAVLAATRELLATLRDHLDLEDEILLPTLETIDAWGPERRKRLAAEHAEQRRVIERAEKELGTADEAGLLIRVGELLDDLETDMKHEERQDLDPSLLTEIPIRVDFID